MTPTLIVTRPSGQAASFAADIRAAWAGPLNIVISPLLEIVPLPATAADVDYVVFTSVHGVEAATRLGLKVAKTAWCVGQKTAQAAKAAGYQTITGPGDADGLVARLIAAHPTGSCAHIRGEHARGDVAARLSSAGIRCDDVVGYAQTAQPLSELARKTLSGQKPVIFPLFSPRTGTILNKEALFVAPAHVVALSDAVKKAVDPARFESIAVADTPTADAMVNATIATVAKITGRK